MKTAQQFEYPWDRWLKRLKSGKRLVLAQGKDFTCMLHCMNIQFRTAAAKRRVPVSVHADEEAGRLTISLRNPKRKKGA